MDTIVKRHSAIDSRYIIRAVENAGNHFFDPSSMRFFNSKVAQSGHRVDIGNGDHIDVLVTSERFNYTAAYAREYTVRIFTFTDHGRAVSIADDSAGFQGYSSSRSAQNAARALVENLANGTGDISSL
jgi:stress-induced morphogen